MLGPYRPFLEPGSKDHLTAGEAPPHRDLFRCFVYQYHLIYFSEDLIFMVSPSLSNVYVIFNRDWYFLAGRDDQTRNQKEEQPIMASNIAMA